MSTIEQIDQQIKQKKVEIESWEKNSAEKTKDEAYWNRHLKRLDDDLKDLRESRRIREQSELLRSAITLSQLCSTTIPDLAYIDSLNPYLNLSNNEKTNSSHTKVSDSQRNNNSCRSLKKLDFKFDEQFNQFMAQYDQNATIPPLKEIEQNAKKISEEPDLTEYISSIIYPFFKRLGEHVKNEIIYESITPGKPDYTINCIDHKFAFFIEMKLDKKFKTPGQTIIQYYNACQIKPGHANGKCNHYACNAVFQIYCYLANGNAQYGMLSTFERSWICKLEKDKDGNFLQEMQIAGPYATSSKAAQITLLEAHSYLEVAFVLFSLMHTSNEWFKTTYEVRLPSTPPIDSDPENDDEKKKDPDFKSPNPKKSKRKSISDGGTQKNSTQLNVPKNNSSIFTTPPHSTSPLSKQKSSLQMPDFLHVKSLEVCPGERSFLGYGRCGKVFKGAVDGVRVAVKVADVSKMPKTLKNEIIDEMRNEAKILHYLNTMGYRYAPKLFYCGYWCTFFYTIATELIPGHYKGSRSELSEAENKNLETAIDCLHGLNVVHNDLKWNNVLFCDNEQVFIIDYGFAKLLDKRPNIEDEQSYDLI